MKIARFNCPSCKVPIETDEATARTVVKCPDCGVEFTPKGFALEYLDGPRPLVDQKKNLKEWAYFLSILSLGSVGVGCFCLLLTLANHINSENGIDAIDGVYFSFGMAMYLWFMAQLIHIRANTEK